MIRAGRYRLELCLVLPRSVQCDSGRWGALLSCSIRCPIFAAARPSCCSWDRLSTSTTRFLTVCAWSGAVATTLSQPDAVSTALVARTCQCYTPRASPTRAARAARRRARAATAKRWRERRGHSSAWCGAAPRRAKPVRGSRTRSNSAFRLRSLSSAAGKVVSRLTIALHDSCCSSSSHRSAFP